MVQESKKYAFRAHCIIVDEYIIDESSMSNQYISSIANQLHLNE